MHSQNAVSLTLVEFSAQKELVEQKYHDLIWLPVFYKPANISVCKRYLYLVPSILNRHKSLIL